MHDKRNSWDLFLPARSHVSAFENMGDYVNKKLQCVITEVNPKKKNLVLSHRAILERELEEKRAEAMKSLEVGQTREGTVTRILDFAASLISAMESKALFTSASCLGTGSQSHLMLLRKAKRSRLKSKRSTRILERSGFLSRHSGASVAQH